MAYDTYANRDAILRQMALQDPRRQDFPTLGQPVPVTTMPIPKPVGALPTQIPPSDPYKFSAPGSNRAVNGVVPSTDPANWNAGPAGVTDPQKFNAIDFDKLGNRDYLNKQQGGSAWSDINGPAPRGWVYNANGGLMKQSGWDKFDDVMTAGTIAGLSGGTLAAGVAPAVGLAALGAATSDPASYDQRQNASDRLAAESGYQPPPPGTSALASASGAETAGADTAAAPTGGITLPDNVDTNGYAKPGYAVAGSPQAPPGWDQTKWADTAHQSPKYAVGRILSQYPQDINGLKQAMPEIAKAYPGAVQTGEDTIQVPGVGEIDVVKAGGGFWWGPETDANGNPIPKDTGGAEAAGGDTSGGYNAGGDITSSDVIAKIIARLGGMAGGQSQGAGVVSARDALLKQFGA